MVKIAPSILAADFLHLEKAVDIVNRYADILHFDVMDGVFVPNISFGFPVIEAVARKAEKPMDVHLMIVEPERYAEKFAKAGASMISFHLDASKDPEALLKNIRSWGVKAGLVINPDIPVEELYPYLKYADYVLLMSVYAGFGGQKFIETTYDRIWSLKAEIERQGLDVMIQVDGGVTTANSASIIEAGVDILVAGSAVFRSDDPASVIASLRGH